MEMLASVNLPQILYGLFCGLSVFFAVGVISFKNPVNSAFSLIMVLINVAAIFAMQEAHFIAAIQILVYAGAIMVLFVFVIMLLNIEHVEKDFTDSKLTIGISILLGLAFCTGTVLALSRGGGATTKGTATLEAIQASGGNIRVISEVMFSEYVLPFEIISVLLLMAIVGAVVLAKRKVE
jgi:NADH-quinone oxidoreductase subunit J